jgi:PPM family protein phosphatase
MISGADPVRMTAVGLGDVGCVRETNEDAFSISEQQALFVVSDGMGGPQAGALAAAMTAKALPFQVSAERLAGGVGTPATAQVAADALVRAIACVNDTVPNTTQGPRR